MTGRPQPIRVEFFENTGWAGYELRWVPPGEIAERVVPAGCLRAPPPPEPAPPPRPVGRPQPSGFAPRVTGR